LTALSGPDIPSSEGCGVVDRMSRYRNARTWYLEAPPGAQHFVVLVVAPLMVLVLITIALLVLAVFRVNLDWAL